MWMYMYVEMHVCEHVQTRRYLECSLLVVVAIHIFKKSFLIFTRQDLSLVWNSLSRPGWLASEPLMMLGLHVYAALPLTPFQHGF